MVSCGVSLDHDGYLVVLRIVGQSGPWWTSYCVVDPGFCEPCSARQGLISHFVCLPYEPKMSPTKREEDSPTCT